jgi:DNA-binding MarR family transcriptional regulator
VNSSAVLNQSATIEAILDELEPLVARQRRAVAKAGCLRAISSTQLHVLFLLVTDGALPMGRLAEQLDVSLPNVTGIIDRMVERGVAERLRDDEDRRLVMVSATPAGRAAVEEIDLVRRRQLGLLLEALSSEDRDRALHVFRALRRAAEKLEHRSDDQPTTT